MPLKSKYENSSQCTDISMLLAMGSGRVRISECQSQNGTWSILKYIRKVVPKD